jgi:hypothetical protein
MSSRQRSKRCLHPNSIANLHKATRFRPGQSGNPAGRPKGMKSINEALRTRLNGKVRSLFDAEAIQDKKVSLCNRLLDMHLADAIAEVILKQALRGNLPWLQLVLDREEEVPGPNRRP